MGPLGEKCLVPELGHLRVRDTQMPGIRHQEFLRRGVGTRYFSAARYRA